MEWRLYRATGWVNSLDEKGAGGGGAEGRGKGEGFRFVGIMSLSVVYKPSRDNLKIRRACVLRVRSCCVYRRW